MDTRRSANLDRIDLASREVGLLHHLLDGQFYPMLDICRGGSFVPCQDIVTLEDDR